MNSVQTLTLNSALSQNWVVCTVRTPRNQVTRTLRAQCPCRGRCSEHNKLVARTASADHALAGRALVATLPGSLPQVATQNPGRDTPRQPAPGRNPKPRSRHPISTGQVATSNRCRDQPLLFPQKRPCRDPKPWSRHQITTRQPESCRDIKLVSRHHSGHSRSRPQNWVTTPFLQPSPKPGRNTKPGHDPPGG